MIQGGFGLYVHWPFCLSKCPYCDFNSHVADELDQARWRRNLLAELDHYGSKTKGRMLDSVFFGGGTPSLMPPGTVAALLNALGDYWQVSDAVEITLEANPTSVEAQKFADFRAAGVNRVSVGVQSLSDDALRFLGRGHSAREARQAISVAEKSFDRFSFDLIYALPEQSMGDWVGQLDDALAMAGDHLSLYQLTIEKGTPFYSEHRDGRFALPRDDVAADMYEKTAEMTSKSGLPAYEVSNHAQKGSECRHNLIYWQGGDYVGIGPGAHGRLTLDGETVRTEQIPGPANWLSAVSKNGHATRFSAVVLKPEQCEELIMTGLRLTGGIEAARFEAQTGVPLADGVNRNQVTALQQANLITWDETRLAATPAGILRLNALISAILC
ncbi:MAG: coproporphyrinogen III oxidase [Rhodospirillaceae bacterium]|nr:coproporphyrinogen III oxidase [Rhodospirillaceae bacterium]